MKKLFLAIAMALTIMSTNAETKREGNTFIQQVSSNRSNGKATKTEYSYTTSKGETYPIWLSANGRAYIVRTSKNTGKEYKQYLDEETSRTICKELKVEYKEKTSK